MAFPPLSWIAPLALPRLTLLLNHIVASEPVAVAKLRPYAGRTFDIRFTSTFIPPLPAFLRSSDQQGWAPPPLRLRITPAGLFEAVDPQLDGVLANGLTLTVQWSDPLTLAKQALRGERPAVTIEGDAALAEVASWMMKNLRWDIEDDIDRLVGAAPAEALRKVGEAIRQGLSRWRPSAASDTTAGR